MALLPDLARNRLAGLTSRWDTFSSWAIASAPAAGARRRIASPMLPRPLAGGAAAPEIAGERLALEPLHHDVRRPLAARRGGGPDVERLDDARGPPREPVQEPRFRAELRQEPLAILGADARRDPEA